MLLATAPVIVGRAGETSPRLELWYDAPATEWTDALPIGNGRIGAMVFGGTNLARFQINEDTLWTGAPRSYAHPGAAEVLHDLRAMLLAGEQRDAERLAGKRFMSIPVRQMSYQPFGYVELQFPGHDHATNYRRSLDLKTAIATTRYEIDGVKFRRESFVSFPDQAILTHVTCDQPGELSIVATQNSPQREITRKVVDERTVLLTGRVRDADIRNVGPVESKMTLASYLNVLHTDGDVSVVSGKLRIDGASTVTLALTAATNFVNFRDISGEPVSRGRRDLNRLRSKNFAEIRAAHIADHQELFLRTTLRLGARDVPALPTDQRVLRHQDHPDHDLEALLMQYGRYLMIASSRSGSQPANLQGIWNDQLAPPWESKYTTNINVEMNYWLAELGNLAECHGPLLRAVEELAVSGREVAEIHYGMPGWVVHHNFDVWRGAAPINASNHGIWPCGGAWLCRHLWEHYLYSNDGQFLRDRAYPLMKQAAEFFVAYLVEDPRVPERYLLSGPSNSPEHGGLVMGPTMDHQIIRGLFQTTAEAAQVLKVDGPLQQELTALAAQIAPNRIGKYGQLQEWLEDIDDPQNRHRHVSHLWAVYPGDEIGVDTPDLFDAAKTSLELRGDGGTGWALAWKINLWARLRDGDRAYRILQQLLTLTNSPLTENRGAGVYPNLFDAHPPFQIDGNFGAAAGICEMLIQSHRRTNDGLPIIELLPALPSAWDDGAVTGLRVRGGFEVELAWEDGEMESATLFGAPGGHCEVRYRNQSVQVNASEGEKILLELPLSR